MCSLNKNTAKTKKCPFFDMNCTSDDCMAWMQEDANYIQCCGLIFGDKCSLCNSSHKNKDGMICDIKVNSNKDNGYCILIDHIKKDIGCKNG